jgi:hypothetical protein
MHLMGREIRYIANLFLLRLVQRQDKLSLQENFNVTNTAVGIFFVPISSAVSVFVEVSVQGFSSLWSPI